jgi:hypothetical protein
MSTDVSFLFIISFFSFSTLFFLSGQEDFNRKKKKIVFFSPIQLI